MGYRYWVLQQQYGDGGGAFIASQFNGQPWPLRRRMEAACHKPDRGLTALTQRGPRRHQLVLDDPEHVAPAEGCTCGIYAMRDPVVFGDRDHQDYISTVLVGKVALWGSVRIGPRGYRARYAYPQELMVVGRPTEENRRLARVLGRRYGVPVLTEADWWDMQDIEWPFS
jgi:hypothetical protein